MKTFGLISLRWVFCFGLVTLSLFVLIGVSFGLVGFSWVGCFGLSFLGWLVCIREFGLLGLGWLVWVG